MLPALPVSVDSSTIDTVDSSPATVHTNVDTSLGLTPARRASGRLSADASTALPNVVRCRSHISPTASSGTTTTTVSCEPVTRRPSTSSHVADSAFG